LRIGRGSLWIRGAQCGNHWSYHEEYHLQKVKRLRIVPKLCLLGFVLSAYCIKNLHDPYYRHQNVFFLFC